MITAGAIIIDEPKITGITPAELILIGKNEVLLTLAFNAPPVPECWTGIFLIDFSMNVTNTIINTKVTKYNPYFNAPAIILDFSVTNSLTK